MCCQFSKNNFTCRQKWWKMNLIKMIGEFLKLLKNFIYLYAINNFIVILIFYYQQNVELAILPVVLIFVFFFTIYWEKSCKMSVNDCIQSVILKEFGGFSFLVFMINFLPDFKRVFVIQEPLFRLFFTICSLGSATSSCISLNSESDKSSSLNEYTILTFCLCFNIWMISVAIWKMFEIFPALH